MKEIITTNTGQIEYTLPLTLGDTYSASELMQILNLQPTDLLSITMAGEVRYPRFQFDVDRGDIFNVVKHANAQLGADADPWGTLDWWYSASEMLDGQSPVDVLAKRKLTIQLVDAVVASGQQPME